MNNGKKPINALPSDVDSSKVECIGLTKREYFAAMAMQGLVTRNEANQGWSENDSKQAIYIADSLLAELEK